MAFLFGAAVGKAGAGAFLGPIGLAVCGVVALGLVAHNRVVTGLQRGIIEQKGNPGNPGKKTVALRQLDGEMNSSEAAERMALGAVDIYKVIKRDHRQFTKGKDGDKFHVEADHIPPKESLKRARDQPEFSSLWWRNPNLHRLVVNMRIDPNGEELLTVQVATHHHRDALSTTSAGCRQLVARSIARGEAKTMLKQAFIIAHPYSSQQIRDDAGVGNKPRAKKILLSKGRTMNIYRAAFLKLIDKYFDQDIINCEDYCDLILYVNHDMYLDRESEEYQEILEIIRQKR